MQREPRNAPSSMITGRRRAARARRRCRRRRRRARRDRPARRSDRRPRVDHRAGADAGADVDVARHQHRAGLDERPAAHRGGRHDAHALQRVDALQRDLVVVRERAVLDDLHLLEAEVQEDRLLQPAVDGPAVGPGSARRASPRSSRPSASSTAARASSAGMAPLKAASMVSRVSSSGRNGSGAAARQLHRDHRGQHQRRAHPLPDRQALAETIVA